MQQLPIPTLALALGLIMQGVFQCSSANAQEAQSRPKLQIINGSKQTVDVFWLKSERERVPNGSVATGRNTIITTTIGHRFAVVGRQDRSERMVTSEVPVQAMRFDPPDADGIPAFYKQRVSAGGFPIVASATVNPYALKEAAYLVDLMLARRPDVREAMVKSGARLCILAWNEFTCDQPEWTWLAGEPVPGFESISTRDYRDARARGMGGSLTDPFCSCAEENLLGYPGDPYAAENILIHELAHNIHLRGMVNVDPTFDTRLKKTYDAAMQAGLWKGKYASVNHHEYFAEGVQSWFDDNRENDHDHNHVNTRAELLEYDPGLAAMCREVFGDTELKYTKPATRLTGHMEGYDPAKAPTFVWPERLESVRQQIRAVAQARDRKANTSQAKAEGGHELRDVEGWQVRVNRQLLRDEEKTFTEQALALLGKQLAEIRRVVPAHHVKRLQEVPLWINPPYEGIRPSAEYHPDAGWLRANKRDPAMAKAVEFTNTRIWERENRRMPMLALHELAHAYHHRVIGHDHRGILDAFAAAKAGGRYESVKRWTGDKFTTDRAYALSNEKEYFAETTEAFFGRNDFEPFNREELEKMDPGMFAVLKEIWK